MAGALNGYSVAFTPLNDILTAVRNPRSHDLAALRASIARFGFVTPGLVDERTSRLVAGHGRLAALQSMRDDGQDPPTGVRLADDGAWLVPVIRGWASRSDTEAEAYLIADNRTAELTGWDSAELADMLADIAAGDQSLTGTGFTADDLAALSAAETFTPTDEEQPRLDQRAPITCPECGHVFSPS